MVEVWAENRACSSLSVALSVSLPSGSPLPQPGDLAGMPVTGSVLGPLGPSFWGRAQTLVFYQDLQVILLHLGV